MSLAIFLLLKKKNKIQNHTIFSFYSTSRWLICTIIFLLIYLLKMLFITKYLLNISDEILISNQDEKSLSKEFFKNHFYLQVYFNCSGKFVILVFSNFPRGIIFEGDLWLMSWKSIKFITIQWLLKIGKYC